LDYVERYAYFGCFDDSLMSGNSLSTLGSTFNTYTSGTVPSVMS